MESTGKNRIKVGREGLAFINANLFFYIKKEKVFSINYKINMIDRRTFLASSIGLGAAALNLAVGSPINLKEKKREPVRILATKWGNKDSIEVFCQKIKEAGYDGLEEWLPTKEVDRNRLLQACEKHQLKLGLLVGSSDSDYHKHLDLFTKNLKDAAKLKPLYINCHSGKDFFSFEQNLKFFETTHAVNQQSNVPIYHETHRSRILYAAPVARNFIEHSSNFNITLDISHWCNVHESFLQDQKETLELVLKRTGHIHARIGHPEGPQVNDPRAPEWKHAVEQHLKWWDKAVEYKLQNSDKPMTFLTEFGPVDYMPAFPYSRKPVADQWEINIFMLNLLKERYNS